MSGYTILNIVLFSSAINILFYISSDNETLRELDTNWKETICTPTYGYWATIEGCILKANISPYHEDKICWIYLGEPVIKNFKYNTCDIIFTKPTRRYFLVNWGIYICIFKIFNIFFFGFPFTFLRCFIDIIIIFPLLVHYEYTLYKKGEDKFNIKRAILVMKEITYDNIRIYNNLPKKIYKIIFF